MSGCGFQAGLVGKYVLLCIGRVAYLEAGGEIPAAAALRVVVVVVG